MLFGQYLKAGSPSWDLLHFFTHLMKKLSWGPYDIPSYPLTLPVCIYALNSPVNKHQTFRDAVVHTIADIFQALTKITFFKDAHHY
jgi:hypothetical protein